MNMHATIKEFSMRSVQSGYKEENKGNQFSSGLAVHLTSAREAQKDGVILELV
jgi:hypothetical protein